MTHLKALKDGKTLPFSIAQVIPGTVMGRSELVSTPEDAKASLDRMSQNFLFNTPRALYAFAFVSVPDCARVHVEALDEVKVRAEDIPDWFIAGATTEPGKTIEEIWNGVGDMVGRDFGKEVEDGVFEVGRGNWPVNVPFRVNSRLTEKMLLGGKTFDALSDCVSDVAIWYKSLIEDNDQR
jgi:nucleoside-diphosphate-sugar epimerase